MDKPPLPESQDAPAEPLDDRADPPPEATVPEVLEPGPDLSRPLSRRELGVEVVLGGAFAVAALALSAVTDDRPVSIGVAAVLVGFYAIASRITFEVGAGFAVPTQLVLVPMLFLLPPATVPLFVAAGLLLGTLLDQVRRRAGVERGIVDLADSRHAIGPALVFVAAEVREPVIADWPVYVAAFAAGCGFDLAASTIRECLGRGIAAAVQLRALAWVYLADALLAPVGLLTAMATAEAPHAVLLLLPVVGLLALLARERSARIRHALALSRAYRGAALDLRTRLEQLGESDERFRLLVASVKDYAIVLLDAEGRVTSWNQGAERIKGYTAEEVVGEHLSLFHLPADIERGAPERALRKAATEGSWEEEGWRRRKDGSRFFAHVVTTALVGDGERLRGFATVTRDVTERRQLEAQLVHRALHDALTDLPNRNLFLDHLRAALRRSRRRGSPTAVLFVDLDRFKLVNDSLGHVAGDRVLVEVARRIEGAVRAGDTVARLGGDEFTVLCEDISEPDSILMAERISTALQQPFDFDGQPVFLDASVGIAFAGRDGVDPETLLRDADAAMYRVKRGGGAYAVFDTRMRSGAGDRLRTESALRGAPERGELRVVYQPQVDLRTGACVGAEALVRWARGPELVGPAQFIPLAEETGLILPIGALVLREACQQAARWQGSRSNGEPVCVSVNLSAAQLAHPGVVDTVEQALVETGADPAALCLEITESLLMSDADAAVAVLTALNDLGVRVAIDDFGKGYSSLSYLRRFPVSLLKVDGSFVTRLGDDASDVALVSAVTGMGHALGLTVVAEWVETAAQVAELRGVGCDVAQGYYFGRPEPAEALHGLLLEARRRPLTRPGRFESGKALGRTPR